MLRCARFLILSAFAITWSVGSATAHDSWLVAEKQSVEGGESARISFLTGEVFPISDAATTPDRVGAFDVMFGSRRVGIEIVELTENALRARATLNEEGYHVIGCTLRPRLITMTGKDFDLYLEGEEARGAIERRAGAPDGPVTEQYTKLTKTIVRVGKPADTDVGYSAVLGQRLEIVPISNPFDWAKGGAASVRVLLDGHPWEGVVLSAGHEGRGKHEYVYRGRTNAAGEASIPLNAGGRWFIKAYHIRAANPLADYSWESLWSSLTFDVQGGGAVTGTATEPQPTSRVVASNLLRGAPETMDAMGAIVAVHGEMSPYAVLGYRMGIRALADLRLSAGDRSLMAILRTPFQMPYPAAADGIQAATHATIGHLSLLITRTTPDQIQGEFVNRGNGMTVRCRPTRAVLDEIANTGAGKPADDLAIRLLEMGDDELFSVTLEQGRSSGAMSPPPDVEEAIEAQMAGSEKTSKRIRRPIRMMGLSEALTHGCRTSME